MSEKLNCWEYKKCGREVGGTRGKDFGICPVALEKRLDGVHNGSHAGRACWVVAGTFCGGQVQGAFATKYSDCKDCDFYKKVLDENFTNIEISLSLLARLKN